MKTKEDLLMLVRDTIIDLGFLVTKSNKALTKKNLKDVLLKLNSVESLLSVPKKVVYVDLNKSSKGKGTESCPLDYSSFKKRLKRKEEKFIVYGERDISTSSRPLVYVEFIGETAKIELQ